MAHFHLRLAIQRDGARFSDMMELAIANLQQTYLTTHQIQQSREVMCLDSQLIGDQTYFIIEHDRDIVACGGWSFRSMLFSQDLPGWSNNSLLDPQCDAARLRAFYTHPAYARRGLGRRLLEYSERDALKKGFTRMELVATLAGEPLYRSCGYEVTETITVATGDGTNLPARKMRKELCRHTHDHEDNMPVVLKSPGPVGSLHACKPADG